MGATFDWLSLDEDEAVVWSDTPHPYSLLPAIVLGLALAVVLVGVVILVGAYLAHRNTQYVVTSDALHEKTGVLSRSVQRIEFGKVQDTSYRQGVLGARFGYGTVDVSTAGSGGVEMRFRNVAEPLEVQTLINERLRAEGHERQVGGRDADEVLDAILAELRAIRSAVDASSDGTAGVEAGSGDAATTDPTVSPADGNGDGADLDATGGRGDGDDPTPETDDEGSDVGLDLDPDEFRFGDES